MLNENHKLNNLSEQSVSGASESSNNLDKTASPNLSTKVPSKCKPKIKLSHQLNGSVPLTVYHKYKRIKRESKCFVKSVISTFSHILCLTEHHMNHLELQQTFFDNYKLVVSYCITLYERGGVCIFVQESLRYVRIDLEKYCKDKDFEVHAIKIHFNMKSACTIAIYGAPSGNFDLFI